MIYPSPQSYTCVVAIGRRRHQSAARRDIPCPQRYPLLCWAARVSAFRTGGAPSASWGQNHQYLTCQVQCHLPMLVHVCGIHESLSSELFFYHGGDRRDVSQDKRVSLMIRDGKVWLNQSQISDLFGTSVQNVCYHIANIHIWLYSALQHRVYNTGMGTTYTGLTCFTFELTMSNFLFQEG